MIKTLVVVLALEVKVIDFEKGTAGPEGVRVTLINPFSPALIGNLEYSGTVQPHVVSTFEMIIGASPTLVKLNVKTTGLPIAILPKSCTSESNLNSPGLVCAWLNVVKPIINATTKINFFISILFITNLMLIALIAKSIPILILHQP